jgi:16S rRNA (cytosine1402-N4)-methyltransferase
VNGAGVIDNSSGSEFSHEPVMVNEIVEIFGPAPKGFIYDGTLGGAGHAQAILNAHEHLSVLGIDRDSEALEVARQRLGKFGDRVCLQHRRFDDVDAALAEAGLDEISGALFDLGVSSFQFDTARRGFSYRYEAPLDMRMDVHESLTAAEIVNEWAEEDISRILHFYGDEKFARKIARSIVASRPITTTTQLANLVASAIPAPARRRGGNPAKRTFQALRIAVNQELDILPVALDRAISRTRSGGRVVVLAYHSGEDRLVKERFTFSTTGGCTCPSHLPCGCGAQATTRRLRVPSRPSPMEREANPRSASARMRAVEVI